MEIKFNINKEQFIRISALAGGILVILLLLIFGKPSSEPTSTASTQSTTEKIDWYDRDKEILDKFEAAENEAVELNDQGRYNEAIIKYKAALDLIEFKTYWGDDSSSYYKLYGSKTKEEQKDILSEYIGYGARVARVYNALSFVYRDAKDLANNLQKSIDAAKLSVEEIDKVIMLDKILKEVNPDGFYFEGIYLSRKASYLSMLGDVYRIYGAYDLSLKAHREAINLAPENADLYVWYGIALRLDGQYSLGCQQFTKALELDASNADASKNKCY